MIVSPRAATTGETAVICGAGGGGELGEPQAASSKAHEKASRRIRMRIGSSSPHGVTVRPPYFR